MPSRVHLGYQCWKGDQEGRWVLRRYIGNNKYRSVTLGRADDAAAADGEHVLTFAQAANGYIAFDAEQEQFSLTPEQAMVFANKESPRFQSLPDPRQGRPPLQPRSTTMQDNANS